MKWEKKKSERSRFSCILSQHWSRKNEEKMRSYARETRNYVMFGLYGKQINKLITEQKYCLDSDLKIKGCRINLIGKQFKKQFTRRIKHTSLAFPLPYLW